MPEHFYARGQERLAEIERAALDDVAPGERGIPPDALDKWWMQRFFVNGEPKIAEIKRAVFTVSRPFPPGLSGEVMVPLIESIACDVPRVLIGNVLNSWRFCARHPARLRGRDSDAGQQAGHRGHSDQTDCRMPCWRRSGGTGWVR